MHIHILGICGTFMGSLAVLAKSLGHKVTGSDANVYPPMSTQLELQGVEIMSGYAPEHLQPSPDLVVIGNAMSRGNPAVEYVLDNNLPYTSGPQWLAQFVLQDKHVIAVSGTHGKTTTSSMLAWILDQAGVDCGYLIGGVPQKLEFSARIGTSHIFVIEADEYDSAFFDKRSKFIHYHPRTLIINNLEFDHADIFADLAAIQRQFHHLIRTVPSSGQLIYPAAVKAVDQVIQQGCWSQRQSFSHDKSVPADFYIELIQQDASAFEIHQRKNDASSCLLATVRWSLLGEHNAQNALSAFVAALQVGLSAEQISAGLNTFNGVKRRLEKIAEPNGIAIYDDFAHHPTAISTTLKGMRANINRDSSKSQLLAVIEPRSNTMRLGIHQGQLVEAVQEADKVFWLRPSGLDWNIAELLKNDSASQCFDTVDEIIDSLKQHAKTGDQIVIMSNGGFDGIHSAYQRRSVNIRIKPKIEQCKIYLIRAYINQSRLP